MEHTAIALGCSLSHANVFFPIFVTNNTMLIKRARGWISFKGTTQEGDPFKKNILVYGKMHPSHSASERLQSIYGPDWFFGTADQKTITFMHFTPEKCVFVSSERESVVLNTKAQGRKIHIANTETAPRPSALDFTSCAHTWALAGQIVHSAGTETCTSLHFMVPPTPFDVAGIHIYKPDGQPLGTAKINAGIHAIAKDTVTAVAQTNKWEPRQSDSATPDFSPVTLQGGKCIGVTPFVHSHENRTWTLAPRIALPDPMYSCCM